MKGIYSVGCITIMILVFLPKQNEGKKTKLYYMDDFCRSGRSGTEGIDSDEAVRFAPYKGSQPSTWRCIVSVYVKNNPRDDLTITFKSMDTSDARSFTGCTKSRLDLYSGPRVDASKRISDRQGLCGHSAPTGNYKTDQNSVTMDYMQHSVTSRQYFEAVITPFHYPPCSSNELRCSNGRCIADHFMCDGYNNCGDDSDETKCGKVLLTIGAIIGIVIGCLVFVGCIVTIVICKCCCSVCDSVYERF